MNGSHRGVPDAFSTNAIWTSSACLCCRRGERSCSLRSSSARQSRQESQRTFTDEDSAIASNAACGAITAPGVLPAAIGGLNREIVRLR